MRRFLRSRRGTLAFAAVVAAIPLIAAVGLGAEAGSWYVTKQHAQNAADAAAYSGALRLACTLGAAGGTPCTDARSVDYRGKEFAAQNAFCNAADTAYPSSRCVTPSAGTTQSVAIATATSAAGPWSNPPGASFVRATVNQTQPTYLVAVLGSLSTVSIGARAIAQVHSFASPCVLALTGSISFQGSPNIVAPNCGMASNSTAQNALNFTGGGMTMNLGSLSAAGGCTGHATFCNPALTNMPPVSNPFSALDSLTLPNLSNCSSSSSLTPYSASTPCKNNNVTLNDPGNTQITLTSGVYFISGTLQVKGNNPYVGNALFILLPGATFDMKGSGSFNVTGIPSVQTTQLPAVLQPNAHPTCEATNKCLLDNMAIYDRGSDAIKIGGNSNLTFNGTMYLPSASVTFQGNPTVNACGELIAASVAFNGNATFNNTGCSSPTKPNSVYVSLVK